MEFCQLHNLQGLHRYFQRTNHKKNIKKKGPDINLCCMLDSTVLYSPEEELILNVSDSELKS